MLVITYVKCPNDKEITVGDMLHSIVVTSRGIYQWHTQQLKKSLTRSTYRCSGRRVNRGDRVTPPHGGLPSLLIN